MRHLIGIEDLSVAEIEELVATAEDIIDNPLKYAEVCRGKKLYDKRDSIAKRDADRDIERAMKERY